MAYDLGVYSVSWYLCILPACDDGWSFFMRAWQILILYLCFSKTSPGCEDTRGAVQKSLVRLLLSVECLQPRISEILLEKVAEFALTGDEWVIKIYLVVVKMNLNIYRIDIPQYLHC